MPHSRLPATLIAAVVAVLSGTTVTPADGRVASAKRCGHTHRAFTDGAPAVFVARGSTSCTSARELMRRYWQADPTGAAARSVTLRGVRWRCRRVTPTSVPGAWACRSPSGRSVVTAAE